MLPTIYKTGIEEIDGSTKSISDTEIPDLDTFYPRNDGKFCRSEILPTLLTTFYYSKDNGLKSKILDVIIKCFSQTWEFMY